MIKNHSHSGLGKDGEKIDYNNLINKLDIRINNPTAGQVLTYNASGYWENI